MSPNYKAVFDIFCSVLSYASLSLSSAEHFSSQFVTGPPSQLLLSVTPGAATPLICTSNCILPLPHIRRANPSSAASRHRFGSLRRYSSSAFLRVYSAVTTAASLAPKRSIMAKVLTQGSGTADSQFRVWLPG